ncbi:uncharacterized protein LOC102902613 [Felis catus]|uniref:uncharacterized protein LOC102902613 n=1 Tax=Felis catus TaxID=9685 RepID=UPI001D19AEE3|nr:uncharacterized protein LOC102902613 [Felis catus]
MSSTFMRQTSKRRSFHPQAARTRCNVACESTGDSPPVLVHCGIPSSEAIRKRDWLVWQDGLQSQDREVESVAHRAVAAVPSERSPFKEILAGPCAKRCYPAQSSGSLNPPPRSGQARRPDFRRSARAWPKEEPSAFQRQGTVGPRRPFAPGTRVALSRGPARGQKRQGAWRAERSPALPTPRQGKAGDPPQRPRSTCTHQKAAWTTGAGAELPGRGLAAPKQAPRGRGGAAAGTSRRARARVPARAGVPLPGAVKRGRSRSPASPELFTPSAPPPSHSQCPVSGGGTPGNCCGCCPAAAGVLLTAEPAAAREFELGRISSLAEWEHISELLTGRRDVFPVAVGGPETKDRPRMAELVVGEKRCASCRGAFCRPACPGTRGHLWRWNHGHIRGLSPLQDGLEGYCPFGAGQAGRWLYEVLCRHPEHRQALDHRAEDGRLFQQTLPAVRARNRDPNRAPAEFPPASDARTGDSGDREVGHLPRDLHPRHEVHHGRVSCSAGLLCPSGSELCWPVVWRRGLKVVRGW